ncbi:TDT family transporter [Pseudomonas monteilii]
MQYFGPRLRTPFPRPLSALSGWLEVVRQFTPQWFSVVMGTGILALLLGQLPDAGASLSYLGTGLWQFSAVLFVLFTGLYLARWVLFFDEARRIVEHPTASMFLGTIPMALATLINGLLQYGLPAWGTAVMPWAQALWWLDVALAIACGVWVPFLMVTRQRHSLEQMTAVWLLPVVAAEVAAVTGGLIVPHVTQAPAQLHMLVLCYVLWAYSVPVALSLLVVLLLRLVVHRLPPQALAASIWLSLGPIGTGALGMLVLGSAAPTVFAANGLGEIGATAAGVGAIGGMLLWGLGVWWLLLAVLITVRQVALGMSFNLGWWAFVFPLGVYAAATLKLGGVLGMGVFEGLGEGLVVVVGVMWGWVAVRTAVGAYRGELFHAPCVVGL